MKKYSQPTTDIQLISADAYVCNLTSITPIEQPIGSQQL